MRKENKTLGASSCRLRHGLAALAIVAALPAALIADPHPNRQRGAAGISMGQFDSVSAFNGNLSMTIPIGNAYHINDGLSYQLALRYNSNIWEFSGSSSSFTESGGYGRQAAGSNTLTATPVANSNAGLGWSLHLGRLLHPNHPDNTTSSWLYVTPSGAERIFYPRLHPEYNATPGVRYTRDGSYLRMKEGIFGADHTIEFPDGTIHSFENTTQNPKAGYLTRMEDRLGNALTVALLSNRWELSDGHRTHRVYFAENDYSYGKVTQVQLAAFGSATATYDFNYSLETIADPCDSGGGIIVGQVHDLLTSVDMPHGLSYAMPSSDYHLDDSGGCRLPGKIKGITLPNLGRIEWTYGDYEFPGNDPSWRKTTAGVVSRKLIEANGTVVGTWNYSPNYSGNEFVNTITSPSPGGISKHYFSVAREDSGLWTAAEYGLPVTKNTSSGSGWLSREVLTNGGTLRRQMYLAFDVDPPANGPGGSPLPLLDEVNANRRVKFSRTRYSDDSNYYADVTYSEWDGLGHHRVATTGGNFPSGGNVRTVTTNYNPGQGTYPSTGWTMVGASQVWLLNDYDSREVSEAGFTARSEFCFHQSTGFLERVRVLENLSQGSDDLVTEYARTASGTNVTLLQKHFGGDTNAAEEGGCSTSMGDSPVYQSETTFVDGGLQKLRRRKKSGSSTVWYNAVVNVVDPNTGLPSRTTDTAGDYIDYGYDLLGRLVSEDPAEDGAIVHTWTAATSASSRTRVVSKFLAESGGGELARTRTEFDSFGRLLVEKRLMPGGGFPARWYGYDAVGNLAHVSVWGDSSEKTTYSNYDPFGRPGTVSSPDGSTISLNYLGARRTQRTSKVFNGSTEVNSTTTEIRDRQGRLKSVQEPSGAGGSQRTTSYAYDVGGRLKSVSGGGQWRTFNYDNRGFLQYERHPEIGPSGEGYTNYCNYDALGNFGKSLNGAGTAGSCQSTATAQSLGYVYDADGLLLEIKEGDGPFPATLTKYIYDNYRRVEQASRFQVFEVEDGNSVPSEVEVREYYQYLGDQGRVSHRSTQIRVDGTLNWTFNQGWGYDDLGNVLTNSYPDCTTCADPARVITNQYSNGWLTGVQESGPVLSISYHPSGMVHEVGHIGGVKQIYEADPDGLGRPELIRKAGPGTASWDTGDYLYDGSGNIKQIGGSGGLSTFSYDLVGRLTSSQVYSGRVANEPGATTSSQSFSYDRFGNMTALTPGYSVPVDDDTNRMTGAGIAYDAAGNVTEWGGWEYEYDLLGNMTHRKTGSGVDRKDWFHAYTADGERILTYYRDDLDVVGSAPLYQNHQQYFTLRDLDGKVLRSWAGFDFEQDYVYRDGTLLAILYPESTSHVFPDHLGTPRLITDSAGNELAFHVYRPYGEELSVLGQDAERMKFTGHERDMGSNLTSGQDDLDYMHARHYNMMVGRFLQPDPVLGVPEAPQSWNLYSYVRGNPLAYTDPTGENVYSIFTAWGLLPQGLDGFWGGITTFASVNGDSGRPNNSFAYQLYLSTIGGVNSFGSNLVLGYGRVERSEPAYQFGQGVGDLFSFFAGAYETALGLSTASSGLAIAATGVGAAPGLAIAAGGAAAATHGVGVATSGAVHFMDGVSGGGKNGRKLRRGAKERINSQIDALKAEMAKAPTKAERKAKQKQIDHLRNQLSKSEPHGRASRRH